MQSHRCRYDYVEVYDGPPHSSPLLGRLCSGSFPTYISSSNMMTVRFHSDSRYTFRGFQAYYSSIPTDHNTSKFPVGVSQPASLFIAFACKINNCVYLKILGKLNDGCEIWWLGVNCVPSKFRKNQSFVQFQHLIINKFQKSLLYCFFFFYQPFCACQTTCMQWWAETISSLKATRRRWSPWTTVTVNQESRHVRLYSTFPTTAVGQYERYAHHCPRWIAGPALKNHERAIVVHSAKKWTNKTWRFLVL